MLNVSSLGLYRTLIKVNKSSTVKGEIIRHTILCIILIIPLMVASLIEAYISSGLMRLYN